MKIKIGKKYKTSWGLLVKVQSIDKDERGSERIHGLVDILGTPTLFIFRDSELKEEAI